MDGAFSLLRACSQDCFVACIPALTQQCTTLSRRTQPFTVTDGQTTGETAALTKSLGYCIPQCTGAFQYTCDKRMTGPTEYPRTFNNKIADFGCLATMAGAGDDLVIFKALLCYLMLRHTFLPPVVLIKCWEVSLYENWNRDDNDRSVLVTDLQGLKHQRWSWTTEMLHGKKSKKEKKKTLLHSFWK